MTIDVAKGGKLQTYKVITPPADLVVTLLGERHKTEEHRQ